MQLRDIERMGMCESGSVGRTVRLSVTSLRMFLPCFVLLVGQGALAGVHPGIEIDGNTLLPDEIFLNLLEVSTPETASHLPPDDRAQDPALGMTPSHPVAAPELLARAQAVAATMQAYMRRCGYELARAAGSVNENRIRIEIDEGRLARVVFRGRGTATTLRAKLLLNLPLLIYNRPHLERQLVALQTLHGIHAGYELVPVKQVEHLGPQLDSLGPIPSIPGVAGIPQDGAYELHIIMSEGQWDRGMGVHMKYNTVEGLRLGTSYRSRSVLFDDDRWSIRGDLATTSFGELDSPNSHLDLSRGILEMKWYTPRLLGALRPFIWTYGDLRTRSRADLGIETYRWLQAGTLLNLGYEIGPDVFLATGFGFEYRSLFAVNQPVHIEGQQPVVSGDQRRGLGNMRLEVDLDPDEVRLDRRDRVDVNLRSFFADRRARLWELTGNYQRVTSFGWHDLWIRSRFAGVFGRVSFAEEYPLNNFVRGVFSDTHVRRAVSLGSEYRFSLTRDVFKLSGFVDGAFYEDRGRSHLVSIPRVAVSAGAGFHALVLDVAQLDLYYGAGYASDGSFDLGLTARVAKAF